MNIRIAVLILFQRFTAATPAACAGHPAFLPASSRPAGTRFLQQVQWYENRRRLACPILRLFCLNFRICALHTARRPAMPSPAVQIRMIGLISDRFRQSPAGDWPYDVTAVQVSLLDCPAARSAPIIPPSAHAIWKPTLERRRYRASRPIWIAGRLRPCSPR
ncbi:hypothetical protein [Burkholderia metallica]|uniref:hypothetical protein n=1 Tax=Burkholderia metallica TaxID=488729 RepID=UPI001CF5FA83|nr:hypothetical protein [Burkholderia metallica]MCA8003203.1 hypothetical protein [Burkholderia metallica]